MLGWPFFVFQNSGSNICSHKEIGGRDEEECEAMLSSSTRIFVAMSFFPHKEIGGGVEESLSPLEFWCYFPSSHRMLKTKC
jgi:hypothetical protein